MLLCLLSVYVYAFIGTRAHTHTQSHSINKPDAVSFLVVRDGCRTLPPLVCRVTAATFVESISTIFF